MWFKQQKNFEALLKPIEEVNSLVKEELLKKGRAIDKTEYSLLHDRFVLTLKQITPAMKLPEKPVSMRVFESDQNGHIAIHDVSVDPQNPNLLKTLLSQKKFLNFQNAIAKIKTKHKDESDGEIRLLDVPALNVEALWLHFNDDKDDKFGITIEFNPKDKELFTRAQFLDMLNQMKENQGKVKKKMGA
jgi:hypothetical protein